VFFRQVTLFDTTDCWHPSLSHKVIQAHSSPFVATTSLQPPHSWVQPLGVRHPHQTHNPSPNPHLQKTFRQWLAFHLPGRDPPAGIDLLAGILLKRNNLEVSAHLHCHICSVVHLVRPDARRPNGDHDEDHGSCKRRPIDDRPLEVFYAHLAFQSASLFEFEGPSTICPLDLEVRRDSRDLLLIRFPTPLAQPTIPYIHARTPSLRPPPTSPWTRACPISAVLTVTRFPGSSQWLSRTDRPRVSDPAGHR
jgi:hypothetical protein